jgi:hypothetical protein
VHFLLSWISVAALAILIDLAYAKWTSHVAAGRTYRAMFWSALCPIIGFASFWVCLHELSALIPSALGCALGTWIAMRWK